MNKPLVLVVDDEPGMLRSVERILSRDYQVVCARLPSQALELLAHLAPDLALLDVRMPEMSGFELMERLRGLRPDADVIFMTGSVSDVDAQLIRAIRVKAFYFIHKPFDKDVLETLVERCLEVRRLSEENRRHVRRLERELALASAFQQSLLPVSQARIEGIHIAARYVPCADLGGDFYDYVAAGAGRATCLVADVSGHGVSAAMLTGVVKSAFHASHGDGYAPLAIVERIAGAMRAFPYRRFVTVLCVRMTAAARGRGALLEYVNAGHPPGLSWQADHEVQLLESTGPLISSGLEESAWEQQTLVVGSGQHVLLYTDGVTETERAGELFGLSRVVDQVGSGQTEGAALLERILHAVRDFSGPQPAPDDLTLLTAHLG